MGDGGSRLQAVQTRPSKSSANLSVRPIEDLFDRASKQINSTMGEDETPDVGIGQGGDNYLDSPATDMRSDDQALEANI